MELREYLRGLRRHWLAVVLLALIGVATAWAWTFTQTPVYEASASAYVAVSQESDSVIPGQGSVATQNYVPSVVGYAGWKTVAEHAIEELGLDATPQSLVGQITVTSPEGTSLIVVTARAGSAEGSAELADAWVRGLHATIDEVEGTGQEGSAPVNVYLGDAAAVPAAPVYPDVVTALVIGGIVGLGFGIAFALIRTASDRRIRPTDPIHERMQLPVVGMLPNVDRETRQHGEHSAYDEALRALRSNLQFMDVDNPPRTIVVTSPMPGDGKSLTACELAKTLAAAGSPVILVDGDLRRSKVATNLGLPSGAGLTDVLAGRAQVQDVVQRVADSPNLLVLTAGTTPPNPSEMLGSDRMRGLIEQMSAAATVIIDAPPLLPVTDGAVLVHQADGALVVVHSGKTTYDLAEKAIEALNRVNGRALGIVLNRVPLHGVDASPYAHAYRYEYSGADMASTPSTRSGRRRDSASRSRAPVG